MSSIFTVINKTLWWITTAYKCVVMGPTTGSWTNYQCISLKHGNCPPLSIHQLPIIHQLGWTWETLSNWCWNYDWLDLIHVTTVVCSTVISYPQSNLSMHPPNLAALTFLLTNILESYLSLGCMIYIVDSCIDEHHSYLCLPLWPGIRYSLNNIHCKNKFLWHTKSWTMEQNKNFSKQEI